MIRTVAPAVIPSYRLSWTALFSAVVSTFDATDKFRVCTLAKAVAYRVRKKDQNVWGEAADVANISASNFYNRRTVLSELVFNANGHFTPLNFRIAGCRESNIFGLRPETVLRVGNASATTISMRGVVPWAYIPRQRMGAPVIRRALEYGQLELRRVQDSESLAMLAALVVPSLLSLLPLALFQEASLSATLAYGATTDILSVFPMVIRGVELIVYGSRMHYSYLTNVEGLWEDKDVVVAVTFAAECRMKPFVRRRGEVMLAVAIALMLLGIRLEYLSRYALVRQCCEREWTGLAILHEHESVKLLKIDAALCSNGKRIELSSSSSEKSLP